jgi:hypothetical protein
MNVSSLTGIFQVFGDLGASIGRAAQRQQVLYLGHFVWSIYVLSQFGEAITNLDWCEIGDRDIKVVCLFLEKL